MRNTRAGAGRRCPLCCLVAIGLGLVLFLATAGAAERQLPESIQPAMNYLLGLVDTPQATTIAPRELAPLIDFIRQDKSAEDQYFATSNPLLDPLVYHEFDLRQSLATILQYAFHPGIPSHVLALSSIRDSYWKEVAGQPRPLSEDIARRHWRTLETRFGSDRQFPNEWYDQVVENGTYLEDLTRPQLEAMVFLDYMKEALGRDPVLTSELALDSTVSERTPP